MNAYCQPPLSEKNILRGKKRAAKLHTTSFVLQNDLHINSDLSKCSPLLAGCDLQAKIKDGRNSPKPLSASLQGGQFIQRSLVRVIPPYSTEALIIQSTIEMTDTADTAFIFPVLRPLCEILRLLCLTIPVTRFNRHVALKSNNGIFA